MCRWSTWGWPMVVGFGVEVIFVPQILKRIKKYRKAQSLGSGRSWWPHIDIFRSLTGKYPKVQRCFDKTSGEDSWAKLWPRCVPKQANETSETSETGWWFGTWILFVQTKYLGVSAVSCLLVPNTAVAASNMTTQRGIVHSSVDLHSEDIRPRTSVRIPLNACSKDMPVFHSFRALSLWFQFQNVHEEVLSLDITRLWGAGSRLPILQSTLPGADNTNYIDSLILFLLRMRFIFHCNKGTKGLIRCTLR
jgi:hypothetical protein